VLCRRRRLGGEEHLVEVEVKGCRGEPAAAEHPQVGLERQRVFVVAVTGIGEAARELAGMNSGQSLQPAENRRMGLSQVLEVQGDSVDEEEHSVGREILPAEPEQPAFGRVGQFVDHIDQNDEPERPVEQFEPAEVGEVGADEAALLRIDGKASLGELEHHFRPVHADEPRDRQPLEDAFLDLARAAPEVEYPGASSPVLADHRGQDVELFELEGIGWSLVPDPDEVFVAPAARCRRRMTNCQFLVPSHCQHRSHESTKDAKRTGEVVNPESTKRDKEVHYVRSVRFKRMARAREVRHRPTRLTLRVGLPKFSSSPVFWPEALRYDST